MLFLIEYHRSQGQIITFKTFDDSDRSQAETSRLDIELDLNRKGIDHEVVILEAADENALRQTHRRYFENIDEIVRFNDDDNRS